MEHPYRFIHQAIDNASDGDTIFVDVGVYHENIIVDKPLIIVGRIRERTVVDGGEKKDTVNVISERVFIENLTITNGSDREKWFTAGIRICSSNVTVKRCIISHNNIGIFGKRVTNITVSDNIFLGDGIVFSPYDKEEFHPHLSEGYFIHNIRNNTVNGKHLYYYTNQDYIMVPSDAGEIIAVNCSYLYISNLSIINSDFPIILVSSSHCIIENSRFSSNDGEIWLIHSSYNLIQYNNITHNFHGICLDYKSQNNVIKSNNLSYNEYMGVILEYLSNNNRFKKNNLLDNQWNAYIIQSFQNQWDSNYWDDWIGLKYSILSPVSPKIIFGRVFEKYPIYLPLDFDWKPADKPWLI